MDINKILDKLYETNESIITVFGDYSLDKYVYSNRDRDELSVETNLTAYQIHEVKAYPGIGGTVAANLRCLGALVYCVGAIGDDGDGFELLKLLKAMGANTDFMTISKDMRTVTYMKPMRSENNKDYKEINRLDFRNFVETSHELEEKLVENLEKAAILSQGVIITDQFLEKNMSVVTDYVRNSISQIAKKYKNKFFYVDSRGHIADYKNIICKCNESEIDRIEKEKNVRVAELFVKSNVNVYFITRGENGITIFEDGEEKHIQGFKSKPPLDICGAGDATNAGIMLGLTWGLSNEESAVLGCAVASITIEKVGVTGTAEISQVIGRLTKTM